MIILVRLRKLGFAHQQIVETAATTEFEILVHLDRFKRTDFDADLAAHAYRDIDIENLRIQLWFAHVVGLFVVAFRYVNALRRAFLLTNLAGDTSQPGLSVVSVVN